MHVLFHTKLIFELHLSASKLSGVELFYHWIWLRDNEKKTRVFILGGEELNTKIVMGTFWFLMILMKYCLSHEKFNNSDEPVDEA